MGQQTSALHKTLVDLERNDPDLVDLDLSNFDLDVARARRLAEGLRNNK